MTDISLTSKIWQEPQSQQLIEALVSIETKEDLQNFLRDILTEKEITEISARLEAARMLTNGYTYADICNKTKLSSRTVARISAWLKDGAGGYKKVLSAHHGHQSPVRAE